MTELMEFAVRAVNSYCLMFPEDPAVIRWRQLQETMNEFRWPES